MTTVVGGAVGVMCMEDILCDICGGWGSGCDVYGGRYCVTSVVGGAVSVMCMEGCTV